MPPLSRMRNLGSMGLNLIMTAHIYDSEYFRQFKFVSSEFYSPNDRASVTLLKQLLYTMEEGKISGKVQSPLIQMEVPFL